MERGKTDTVWVRYTKDDLLEMIEEALLDYTQLKDVPHMIVDMANGNHYRYIKKKLDNIFNKNTAPDGMRISVYCSDQTAYHSEAVIRELYQVYPYMAGYHINDVYKAICDCWKVPPVNPLIKKAFYSDKPVLLADGAMDPACCPLYIDMIHHYMPNSQRLLFLNRTHGVGGPDFNTIRAQFLDEPYKAVNVDSKEIVVY